MKLIDKLLVFENAWSEDKKRKSYLLNFISLVLLVFILAIIAIRFFGGLFLQVANVKENFLLLIFIFLALCFMIFLIKKGFVRLISFSIVALLLVSSVKGSLTWGIDLYTVAIMYPLIILISAVLISSRFSLFILLVVCLVLSSIYFLQYYGYIFRDSSWRGSTPNFLNLLTVLSVYALMAFISWLSSRETEKSLLKAKQLGEELELHNRNLEITVEKRTKELKLLQLKQLTRVAPLLDLGKLSAGLIHDIRQPLSVLSLILQNAERNKNIISDLDQAFLAVDKIDDLSKMSACKLFSMSEFEVFNLNLEIKKLVSLFEYKSRIKKVRIIFKPSKEYELYADRKKLNQILANLILNALESYENLEKHDKNIFIKLIRKPRNLIIKVKDYGIGINNNDLPLIFEPNFSSKSNEESLGFGLYVSQEAMTKVYKTKIKVESEINNGSTFTLFIKNKFVLDNSKSKVKVTTCTDS